MKRLLLVCLWAAAVTACGNHSKQKNGSSSQNTEAKAQEVEFAGMKLGGPISLDQCATDLGGGDYNVPSLQPNTPCWFRLSGMRSADDGIPESDPFFGIMFKQNQLPSGVSTRAWANVHDKKLGQIVLFRDNEDTAAWLIDVPKMLEKKFGKPNARASNGASGWTTAAVSVRYYPVGERPSIFVFTRDYEAYRDSQKKAEHATSF